MKIGDIVTRKSYNKDILFTIVGFNIDSKSEKMAILKGVALRVIADAYLDDLEPVNIYDIKKVLIDPTVENLIYKSNNIVLVMGRNGSGHFFDMCEEYDTSCSGIQVVRNIFNSSL